MYVFCCADADLTALATPKLNEKIRIWVQQQTLRNVIRNEWKESKKKVRTEMRALKYQYEMIDR